MRANSEGSGAGRLSDKYHNLTSWLKYHDGFAKCFVLQFSTIVSYRNTQQIAAGDVAAWNVLITPGNGITAAAIFIVSEL